MLIALLCLAGVSLSVAAADSSVAPLPEPLHHWRFETEHIRGDALAALRGPQVRLLGAAALTTGGGVEALRLDGMTASARVIGQDLVVDMPKRDLSVEAWVVIEKPLTWGGIAGIVRDNGADESGWLLGYRDDHFSFALATTDKPSLTYLTAPTAFEPDRWYHVLGTYDGAEHRLYVNGVLVASDTSRRGDLLYPRADVFYELGAYHDSNEYYRATGLIREVAVYDVALTPELVAARYAAGEDVFPQRVNKPEFFRPSVGPWVQFDTPTSATVYWQTATPTPSVVEYGEGDRLNRRVETRETSQNHRVELTDLTRRDSYSYRVVGQGSDGERVGQTHTLENGLNYSVAPVRESASLTASNHGEALRRAARDALELSGVQRGYCLVYGLVSGELVLELLKRSKLICHCVEEDAQRAGAVRAAFEKVGVYGSRVTVRHVADLSRLPHPDGYANLVVSERAAVEAVPPEARAEIERVLLPGRGVALLHDWPVLRRDPPPGAGEWTHQYGRADNSSYGGETLNGATRTDQLQVKWLGRPGADFGLDRNPRMPAPLCVNGRLFHQGMNRIIALEAHNGAVLWQLEIPDLRRVNLPRDASNWCADEEALYVALRDRCWVLDGATGELRRTLSLPTDVEGHEWGYVAQTGQLLLGSAVRAGGAYTEYWGHEAWYDKPTGPGNALVCSDLLFARSKASGDLAWARSSGAVVNATLTVGEGRLFFLESRAVPAGRPSTGRMDSPDLWRNLHLVAVEVSTGKQLWEQPVSLSAAPLVCYLAYADQRLVLVASSQGKYRLSGFAADTGALGWQAEHKWTAANHSGHMQHPVLVGGVVYLEPCGYDLRTGKLLTEKVGRREGCATYAATDSALLYRGQSRRIALWDREAETVSSWFNLRPSCWLSTLPAAGMVLSPEGGGGCSCGNWLETSLGFVPRAAAEEGAE